MREVHLYFPENRKRDDIIPPPRLLDGQVEGNEEQRLGFLNITTSKV